MSSQAEEVEIKALENNESADIDQLANLQRELGKIARSKQMGAYSLQRGAVSRSDQSGKQLRGDSFEGAD
jgi:hypothetical protein